MQQPILTVGLPLNPVPALRLVKFDVPTMSMLPDPSTMLVMCADGATLAVRYVTAGEVTSLLRQGTLMTTAAKLRETTPWAYFLINGIFSPMASGKTKINDNATGWEWNAVQGALLSLQEAGIGVYFLRSETYIADTLYVLAKRDRGAQRVRPPREALFVTPGEDMLMALPGLGEATKDALLAYTGGNPSVALDALTDMSLAIPGVPKPTQAKAREALGLPNGVRLGWIEERSSDESTLAVSDHHEQPTDNITIITYSPELAAA